MAIVSLRPRRSGLCTTEGLGHVQGLEVKVVQSTEPISSQGCVDTSKDCSQNVTSVKADGQLVLGTLRDYPEPERLCWISEDLLNLGIVL